MERTVKKSLLHKKDKATLAKSAYYAIKDAIVKNEFKPGEILSENMLADLLEMSRTPIREALKELKNDDLVLLVPGTGIFVREISEKELRDIFDVRISLECLAAQTAPGFFDQSEVEGLLGEWFDLYTELEGSNPVDWNKITQYDHQLHNLLVHKSHNDCLNRVYKSLQPKLLRYQSLCAQSWGNAQNTVNQHIEILRTLQNKDIKGLAEVLEIHLRAALDIIAKKI